MGERAKRMDVRMEIYGQRNEMRKHGSENWHQEKETK